MPLYAAQRIPESWIVDVTDQRVLRYPEPSPEGYRRVEAIDGVVPLSGVAQCSMDLTGLFDT